MISFQTCIGSAYSSHPVRWIETPEAARAQYALERAQGKPIEKAIDPDKGKPRSDSGDILDLSPDTLKAIEQSQNASRNRSASGSEDGSLQAAEGNKVASESPAIPGELTPEQQQEVASLKARDLEIRAHEMAHVIAGGPYVTSGPAYEYKVGPDGKGYAVAGSVGIDTSPVAGDPEATISKMQTIAAAAMAPAKPSGQDHKVAAQARQAESKARAELAKMRTEEQAEEMRPESETAGAFSVVRTADTMVASPSASGTVEEGAMSSLVKTHTKPSSDFAPSSAYNAQSSAVSSIAPRFSAFA